MDFVDPKWVKKINIHHVRITIEIIQGRFEAIYYGGSLII
jgi:hypothetical protein